jgi:hypothetical protein
VNLKYPSRCLCGSDCPAGTEVRLGMVWEPIGGKFQRRTWIAACPRCDDSLSRGKVDLQTSDLKPECQGGNLAARMRRQAEKRQRRKQR